MKPIQLWLPTVGQSLGGKGVAADAQRAFNAWRGECRVFIIPGLPEPRWWSDFPGNPFSSVVAIGGERTEVFVVLHVGENGYLSGFSPIGQIEQPDTEQLVRTWLNLLASGEFVIEAPKKIMGWIDMPVFTKGKDGVAGYTRVDLERAPGAVYSIVRGEEGAGLSWEIPGHPSPVFPDAESIDHFWKALERVKNPASKVKQIMKAKGIESVSLRIAGPLANLFPIGPTVDTIANWTHMRALVKLSATDPEEALLQAKTLAAPYLSMAESAREWTWFFPLLRQIGPSEAILRGAEFGLNDSKTLAQVLKSKKWRAKLAERVPVIRALGPVGLFWALLLQQLEEKQPLSICKRCGWFLKQGRKKKDYCGRGDNLDCYKTRTTQYQRKSRQRKTE